MNLLYIECVDYVNCVIISRPGIESLEVIFLEGAIAKDKHICTAAGCGFFTGGSLGYRSFLAQ